MTADPNNRSSHRSSRLIIWISIFAPIFAALNVLGWWHDVFSDPVLTIVVLVATVGLSEWIGRLTEKAAISRETAMRRKVAEFFATISVQSHEDERYAFDGRTAVIVQDEESLYAGDVDEDLYRVKRFARNPSGEYFWFILEIPKSGIPSMRFVKHVAHDVARVVLKERYIPPPP